MSSDSSKPVDAHINDRNIFLTSYDNAGMYSFVMPRAWAGTAVGTGIVAGGLWFGLRRSPFLRQWTNFPTRAFLLFSGAATGFTIASDFAMVEYYKYHDRPELKGFDKLDQESALQNAKGNKWEMVKGWSWDHRFQMIGSAWAATMAGVIARDYYNPHLTSVHKFGHARIAAQIVTLAAAVAAFALSQGQSQNDSRNKMIEHDQRNH